MTKLFIDGQEGTTGLQIQERLAKRTDITLLEIPADKRKDPDTKRHFLNNADIVILCLPDDAARESVSMIENSTTRVIDASTAYRTAENWAYGLPELTKNQRSIIKNAMRVSNPGCYATGFTLLVRPLVENGIIPPDFPVSCSAVSGYSGAGKKMIAAYETADPLESAAKLGSRSYALGLNHKHLPEMKKHSGLSKNPLFMPIVCDYYNGMNVTIPLHIDQLDGSVSLKTLHALYSDYFSGEVFVPVMPLDMAVSLESGFLNPVTCNGTNRCEIFVFGNESQIVVAARLDNLGKGASGAAVQNMNIMLGIDETTGLLR